MAGKCLAFTHCRPQLAAPRRRRTVTYLALCVILIAPAQAAAQSSPDPIVNPRAIEFDVSAVDASVRGYRVELFRNRSNTASTEPVKAIYVPKPRGQDEPLRVDLRELLKGVPDGEYVATVRAVTRRAQSARSEPTEPFTVSGMGRQLEESAPRATASESKGSETDRESWPWTVVGIAIGAAAFLVPFLVR